MDVLLDAMEKNCGRRRVGSREPGVRSQKSETPETRRKSA
jgi:hypothetical protein